LTPVGFAMTFLIVWVPAFVVVWALGVLAKRVIRVFRR